VLPAGQVNHVESSLGVVWPARRKLGYESTIKRGLDLVLAVLGLVAIVPIWIAIVIAVKVDSPGPAIFVQDRVGHKGRRFRFYKFRSMYVDAEQRMSDLQSKNEVSGPVFKMRRDPRVTRVGALLRRTSLDELPQLLNILKGEMSLVGPRPALPNEVEQYRPTDALRLGVKPGLTCLWQISGRSTVGFDRWMEYDREYVQGLSLKLDLSILLRTVGAVVSCKGAF
jgi:lipopolysaccharide/colanic/teichoic acid biosynthesis glycosyltransferase